MLPRAYILYSNPTNLKCIIPMWKVSHCNYGPDISRHYYTIILYYFVIVYSPFRENALTRAVPVGLNKTIIIPLMMGGIDTLALRNAEEDVLERIEVTLCIWMMGMRWLRRSGQKK